MGRAAGFSDTFSERTGNITPSPIAIAASVFQDKRQRLLANSVTLPRMTSALYQSDSRCAAFLVSNPDCLIDLVEKNLAVPDFAGGGILENSVYGFVNDIVL